MSPDWKKSYDSLLKEDEETGEDNKKIMFTTVNLRTFIFSYMDKAKQKYNLVAR